MTQRATWPLPWAFNLEHLEPTKVNFHFISKTHAAFPFTCMPLMNDAMSVWHLGIQVEIETLIHQHFGKKGFAISIKESSVLFNMATIFSWWAGWMQNVEVGRGKSEQGALSHTGWSTYAESTYTVHRSQILWSVSFIVSKCESRFLSPSGRRHTLRRNLSDHNIWDLCIYCLSYIHVL